MKSEWSWRRGRPVVVEYVAAILFVAAAAIITILLRKIFPATPAALFFCAVILSAWFGGLGPGLLAAVLSGVTFIFMPFPSLTHEGLGSVLLRLTLFLFTGIFISWISGEQKRAQAALQLARDELEHRVNERTGELTAANEGLRTEIAERKRAEALLDGQKQVLEMVAANVPLEESLTALVRLIETQVPGMLGSILLLDEKEGSVRHCAAPSLPSQYVAAINGLAIGPEAGSCGTAVYRKEAVVVEDIATDPRWKDYRAMALPHGLRACWSTPIFDIQRRGVVGTFAMYYRQPALPKQDHLRLIEAATHLASIAISSHCVHAALRESEAKLKEAQRIGNIGYWERDLLADRITWSDETCRIWGVPVQENTLTQAKLQERIHPDDRQLQKQALDDAIHGRRPYEVECRIVRPNGEVRFIHVRDEVVCDESRKVVRLFGTVQDITERKLAERELRETKSKLEVILDASPLPITGLDPAGRISSWNKAAEQVFGWTAEETMGHVCQTVPPDEMEDYFDMIRKVMQGETILGLVRYRRKKGGALLTCNISVAPQLGERGEPTGATVIIEDVTERKRAEEAVRESQQLLNQVLATLPVGVMVTDPAGNIMLGNAAAKRIWGEMIVDGQERWAQSRGYWHDSGRKIDPADWASVRALTKGETSLNELVDIETFTGQQKVILASAAPIRNVEGQIVGAVIVIEDVTELKRNEEKLHQTEAELARVARLTMVGELTASIAHEVNQPLAAVVTNANAASRWLGAAQPNLEEAREAVHRIARDGNRASEVIKRIRAMVKKGEPSRKPLDLNELVQETIALTQPELSRKKVSLQTELAPGLPQVPADRVQLQQVLLNLVVNAVDSLSAVADRPRTLCICTSRLEPDAVQVAVQDTGVGMELEQIERVFQPFYTTKPHGLGMGLAISRSIVEAHGGHLQALPNNGCGATFQFTLPVQDGGGL